MSIFKKKSAKSFVDAIRCDQHEYLVWKWHPPYEDRSVANAVRWGSSIHIKEGEAVVFIHSDVNGTSKEFLVGPYDGFLITANLPILSKIISIPYGGDSPFPAEIYYINTSGIIQTRFAIPFFDVFDPSFPDYSIPVAARGTISFHICNIDAFIQTFSLQNFSVYDFKERIRDAIARYAKNRIANTPKELQIPVVQIENAISEINDKLMADLSEKMKEDFCIEIVRLDIGDIEIDKDSNDYAQLISITKNMTAARINAQNEDYTERLRIQREEHQYALRKQSQSANLAAFQVEQQSAVGIAGAEAIGNMSSNNSSEISGTGGMNPTAIISGIAIGGSIGRNIADTVNSVMQPLNSKQTSKTELPPPVPNVSYYVVQNGQATGPFTIQILSQMASSGLLSKESLVWKQGLDDWVQAEKISDLEPLFYISAPPVVK